jgi:uncharacterized membrane protein (DUF106 family)
VTNEVYIVTNSVVTSLDVFKQINDTYSTEFTRLLTVMGLLVGFGAVVLPLLFQFKEARIGRAQMKSEFQTFIDEAKVDIDKKITEKFEAQQANAKKEMELLETRTNAAILATEAGTYHVQGNFELSQGRLATGLKSYINALQRSISASNLNKGRSEQLKLVQQNLRFVTESVLPKMKKVDFSDAEIITRAKNVIGEAKKIECSKLLDREIEHFEKELTEAQSRNAG